MHKLVIYFIFVWHFLVNGPKFSLFRPQVVWREGYSNLHRFQSSESLRRRDGDRMAKKHNGEMDFHKKHHHGKGFPYLHLDHTLCLLLVIGERLLQWMMYILKLSKWIFRGWWDSSYLLPFHSFQIVWIAAWNTYLSINNLTVFWSTNISVMPLQLLE